MAMIIVIMMRSLRATKVIKNARPRRQKLTKNFCPLLGIHQDGRIRDRKIVEITDSCFKII